MRENDKLSRRTVIAGLTGTSALCSATVAAEATSPDAELIALGWQLDAISAALDRASGHDEAIALLDKIETLNTAIVAMRAKTLQGL